MADPGVSLEPANRIHPTAVVGDGVVLGRGNVIGPHAVILGPCTIGDGNWIGPHAVIGTPGEHRRSAHPDWLGSQGAGVEIGDGSIIRELVTVQQGTVQITRVGSNCFITAHSHVPHDAEVEDGCTVANATIGGHAWIGRDSFVGLGVVIHQWLAIGAGSMLGMQSAVTRDVPPFALAVGSPARIRGANRIGLQRRGVDPGAILVLEEYYASRPGGEGPWAPPPGLPPEIVAEFERFLGRAGKKR